MALTLGFLTAPHLHALTPDDRLVLPYLAALGIHVKPILWPDPRWQNPETQQNLLQGISALVMRSCWGYHQDPEAFAQWLTQLQALADKGLPVWNTPDTFRQNMHKAYLHTVQAAGHAIVPTQFADSSTLRSHSKQAWCEILQADPALPLVLKPAISASGEHTHLWRDSLPQGIDSLTHAPWMIQPFVESIASAGEYSLVFLGGRYSHSVRKLPAAQQFLVHEEHGGLTQACIPAPELWSTARRLMDTATDLYTRLDYVWYQGQWCLMEIERIEPSLYLAQDPQAPLRWAETLAQFCADFGLTLTSTHSL